MEEEVSNNGGPWRARMNSRAPRQKEKKKKCRQRETWWWCDEVEKAVETKNQKSKEWKKAEECEKDMKQAEYNASRNEAKRCIARVQAEVMKK